LVRADAAADKINALLIHCRVRLQRALWFVWCVTDVRRVSSSRLAVGSGAGRGDRRLGGG
jgi:hypothetical protein